jgi:uncharacterized protein (DUF849 family)
MQKLIIEARINEYEMRDGNPHVPWTPAEIAADAQACREAGAAIVHFHPRTPDGGADPDPRVCGEIIRRIRDVADILVYPTLGSLTREFPILQRLEPIIDLAATPATRPDIVPLCLSSPNWDFHDADRGALRGTDHIYLNPTDELIVSIKTLQPTGVGLECVSWEVGATRRIAALRDAGILRDPIIVAFHLTSGGMLAGHPGTAEGLDTHLAFLPDRDPYRWAVMNLHGSMLPLAEAIIRGGGHVQLGIGDYHYGELGAPTNAALVREVVRLAEACGREVATPEEARRILGLPFGSAIKGA